MVVPHPYEPKMNLRLQTIGVPAIQVLRAGLKDMMNVCDEIEESYRRALGSFEAANPSNA